MLQKIGHAQIGPALVGYCLAISIRAWYQGNVYIPLATVFQPLGSAVCGGGVDECLQQVLDGHVKRTASDLTDTWASGDGQGLPSSEKSSGGWETVEPLAPR